MSAMLHEPANPMSRHTIPDATGLNVAGPARFGVAILACLAACLTAASMIEVPHGLHLAGRMTGAAAIEVRHETGGLVDGIHVKVGTIVKAGDLLISLDTKALGARMAAMKLEAEAAQAQIGALKSEAFALLQSSEAQNGGRKKLVEIESKVAAVETSAVALDARIEAAERDLANRHIRAPIAGRVTMIAVASPGAELAPSQRSVSIEPRGRHFILDAPLTPAQRAAIKPGAPTTLRAQFLSSLSLSAVSVSSGVIEAIDQPNPGTPETIGLKAQSNAASATVQTPAATLPATLPNGRLDLFVETGRSSLWKRAAPFVAPDALLSFASSTAVASVVKDRLP